MDREFDVQNGMKTEETSEARVREALENDEIDQKYGFARVKDTTKRTAFLINMQENEIFNTNKRLISVVDYYFIETNGNRFKVSFPFEPYFYILVAKEKIQEISQFLSNKYSGHLLNVEAVYKEDLDLPNHLIGIKQKYLKLTFMNVSNMIRVRKDLLAAANKNKEMAKNNTHYHELLRTYLNQGSEESSIERKSSAADHLQSIIDIREYDVPYHVRVSIDNKIFCGKWYDVQVQKYIEEPPVFKERDDILERPDLVTLAFDIETTKLPLKFPDAAVDQIMMISYMINGDGFLINNRQIISADVESFNYSPKPEFKGFFTVFNEPDEKAVLIKFFDHIMDVKPNIFVTYNGDFFDWPFVETRAAVYGLDMKQEIGFSAKKSGVYYSRPAMHMDCLCWVKRDSYLPVGSQNLKAVAKAKLRYDPVELDPEDMCMLAAEQPQVLCNYSVSDAIATYYLYMKYVYPFIFALTTIIPMEPDEVLRKGSGTLCETLLMVEAFHANIIFPNKEQTALNKMTKDGHILHLETYVGGHVEALESGVFRADIPCRFRLNPLMIDKLIAELPKTIRHAVEEEEKVPMNMVENLEEITKELEEKLLALKNIPNRLETPIIYHLDVGAMYPNIILTNRLQPTAMVNESICASCDFNRPNATCKRDMTWTWRGEYMPPSRGEYQRIVQQLETEKFPPLFPGQPQRAFHQLSKVEQAEIEKKRLMEYSKKAYGKTKITKVEDRVSTVCQKENSFYVDTVRAFRDRRYEYKALNKKAKQDVAAAIKSNDIEEIKLAKGREIIFDSLQLAHKCILNSFYGYVMRRGARWHSMEMGGIVCYTGAHIIMKAREIIEQVGRPLELDTDGIWCLLPSSFPETFTVQTSHPKKGKMVLSYPNAVLNTMVQSYFTNDQYYQLVDPEKLKYEKVSENSIFFEVDGPYLAMVLPASKEEGKKLKKRYAVYNFDGSLAELKGFEVKRRGELQLIKIFQSSVFQAFLKGTTLEECYTAVARVANYWLDILFNKGADITDKELFDLISENRSMSKKLDEYGSLKSTSISTAKRLAEFLGDQMVKDKGLACKFIISKKPEGAPVTERAIPLAIFQSEDSIKHHYLRKWLKDATLDDVNIRDIIDWNYYIERLGGTIQKIITIPAAMQGVTNPVPRIQHPKWLHHKIVEKNDVFKQRTMREMFAVAKPKEIENIDINPSEQNGQTDIGDVEDIAKPANGNQPRPVIVTKRKRQTSAEEFDEDELKKSWREVLGAPPVLKNDQESITTWVKFHKRKWAFQAQQRNLNNDYHSQALKRARIANVNKDMQMGNVVRSSNTLGGFLKRAQKSLLDTPWQILQIIETNEPGLFKMWVMIGLELHQIRLNVPRIIYVNYRKPMDFENKSFIRKCTKILPRGHPVLNLYQYTLPEKTYQDHSSTLQNEFLTPDVEGIYESQISLEFRVILQLGCICRVKNEYQRALSQSMRTNTNSFSLEHLELSNKSYLPETNGQSACKHIYLYHYKQANSAKAVYGLFLTPSKNALIIVVDTVKTNQMPKMSSLYATERLIKLEKGRQESDLPPEQIEFDVRIENSLDKVNQMLSKAIQQYMDEKKGPTFLAAQTHLQLSELTSQIPLLNDLPIVKIQIQDADNLFNTLEWQKVGAKNIIRHYLNSVYVVDIMREQSRYLHIPLGNLPMDTTLFGADLFFARFLARHNFVLWYSPSDKPDLGGHEADDNRLLTDFEDNASVVINKPGCYSTVCIELSIEMLAVNTLLQSHHVFDMDSASGTAAIGFHTTTSVSLDKYMGQANTGIQTTQDEEAACAPAFRILKAMVNTWLRDISLHKNTFADFQITHFYRWLKSPQALMFEPALCNMLHSLMKKAFIQLIAQFRELGAVVIFGNFNKLLICTKKNNIEESVGYIEFIAQSIRNKEIFHSIDLDYKQCWKFLLWLDQSNHAGVKGNLPKGLITVGESKQDEESENKNGETNEPGSTQEDLQMGTQESSANEEEVIIAMLWNVLNFLPDVPYVKNNFNSLVSYYISNVYQYVQNDVNRFSSSITQTPKRPSTSQGFSQISVLGLDAHKSAAECTKKLLKDDLSFKMFKIVQKIHKELPECDAPKLSYVHLLNDHQQIRPPVEFIKTVCKILSLDSSINDEVTVLRRNMFRLVGVSDFSDEAEWRNPCISFVLPEIVCDVCNNCRDIDVCQDTFKIMHDNRLSWYCPDCQSRYNTADIEFLLIDSLNKKSLSYTLQDGYCTKCLEVKMKNMDFHCSCGGAYQGRISKQDLIIHIKTFNVISKQFKMPILSSLCDWHLEGSSK